MGAFMSFDTPDAPGLIRVSRGRLTPMRFPANVWDYRVPDGPIRFEIWGSDFGAHVEEYDTLEHAMARFADFALPVWRDNIARLVDRRCMMILGYNADEHARKAWGPYGCWFGVEATFTMLAKLHDPIEVAVWETMAKELPWAES